MKYSNSVSDNLNSYGKEAEIKQSFREKREFAYRNWAPFIEEATKDYAFFLGRQWSEQDKQYLRLRRRNALVFNKLRRLIKSVTGHERRTRHSLIAQAMESTDEKTADQLTSVLLWLMNHASFNQVMSDAFEAALKTGVNLVSVAIDYSDDPINGDIKPFRIPYNAFLLDPRFTRRDLSDCEYVLQRRQVSREEAKVLLPSRADIIDDLPPADLDEYFPYMTRFADSRRDCVMSYDEYWQRKIIKKKVILDRDTGESVAYNEDTIPKERLNQLLIAEPSLAVITRMVPSVELNVLVNGEVLYSGDDPYSIGDLPHTMVAAFWDPEFSSNDGESSFADKMQSLIRPGRDVQTEQNKRRSKMLDILDSKLNSGYIAKQNALVNPKDVYDSGQGKTIWLKDGAQMTDIIPIPPADLSQGMLALSQIIDADLPDILGISDEVLGVPDNQSNISGETVRMRQAAGLTVLQDLFDNFRFSQKLIGQKLIKAIQGNFSPGKIFRIINEKPTPAFYTSTFGKFDISVEEAMETPSQKALAYSQILEAARVGVIDPEIAKELALEYLPIQGKDKILEKIQAKAQRDAAVQQQAMQTQELVNQMQAARLFADVGLGIERIARSEADRGLARERISEMQQNNAQANLARAKFIKELQGIEIQQLAQLLDLSDRLDTKHVAEAEMIAEEQEDRTQQELAMGLSYVQNAGEINATMGR